MKNKLYSDILSAQENERKRIADDLHDTTIQELIALIQQLDITNMVLDKDPEQARLELAIARRNVKNIIDGMRNTIYDLRPMTFDDIGWDAAFERLQSEIEKNDISVIFDIVKSNLIDSVTAITIYRIVREACNNVVKHAHAKHLEVLMYIENDILVISVVDDGVGFNVFEQKQNHFGLNMMKERIELLSGTFDISSSVKGTNILIRLPL